MNNIIRTWNRNRKGIIIGIIVIALFIVFIQFLNNLAKKNQQEVVYEKIDETLPTKSLVGEASVSKEITTQNVNEINQFIEKCNNKDISGAYEMLTDYCKNELFPTEDSFKTKYINSYFSENRLINIEYYKNMGSSYIYLVKMYNDVLSSGSVDKTDIYQDYITVDKKNEKGCINVKSLIYVRKIEQSQEKNGIKITVLKEKKYKDNEIFEIKIENNTEKAILIDSKENQKSVYLTASNNATYSSNIKAMSEQQNTIQAKQSKLYTIVFNKSNVIESSNKSISFSDIVTDVKLYNTKSENVERIKITVNL